MWKKQALSLFLVLGVATFTNNVARGQAVADLRAAAAAAIPATIIVRLPDDPGGNANQADVVWQRNLIREGNDFSKWVRRQMEGSDQTLRCGFAVAADLAITMNIPAESDQVTVWVDGKEQEAKVIARDTVTGLTAIRIESDEPLAALAIESNVPEPGQPAAVAWVHGDDHVVVNSAMITSGPLAVASVRGYTQLIDTNVTAQAAGAPIVNTKGALVGVVAVSKDGDLVSLPVAHVQRILDAASGENPTDILRGRIGIALGPKNQPWIVAVTDGLPAADVGIQAGDRVAQIGRFPTKTQNDVLAATAMSRAGDEVEVTLRRGDELITKTVKLAEQLPGDDRYAFKQQERRSDVSAFKLDGGKLVPLDGGANAITSDVDDLRALLAPFDRDPIQLKELKVERTKLEEAMRKLEAEKRAQDEKIRKLTEQLEKLKK